MKKLNNDQTKFIKDMGIALLIAFFSLMVSCKLLPPPTVDESVTPDVTTETSIDETVSSEDISTEDISTEEISTEEITSSEASSEESISEESSSEESISEEASSETISSSEQAQAEPESLEEVIPATKNYHFRNDKLLTEHFEKHGNEFSYATKEEYEAGASAVVNNPNALHKIESDDGDDVYYIEATNEFVIVSTDGYIRTYFKPSAGIDYYNRQ